ncbi:CsgG/HfaB family protein [Shewanella sedimentimangrovi]|uniref:Curli production assembly/transport component CsgG n=1 Tax=Shewanella sedimentimangrovi TaxID=2814293 RepID=A0ABX7R216_9GAMM|nr:CsgG/HfaB family protein [Shewanella sedimentimangrovi]QSX37196.1 hypothetical protein JYB85_18440 [Shewanella sedimentimangrovi]
MKSSNRSRFLCSLWLLCAPFAHAATVDVEVRGSGMSRELAIENALIEAVRQVRGVEIDQRSIRQSLKVKVNHEAVLSSEQVNETASRTQGYVEQYQVLEEDCDEQECQVLITASIPVYKGPGIAPDNRRKLVVSRFSGRYGEQFSQYLQTQLVQSRRFAVLDRERNSEFVKERNLLLSSETARSEKIRLGQVLGMDYLVLGSVDVDGASYTNTLSLTGEQQTAEYGEVKVSYQLINIATRQIKWQDDAIIALDSADADSLNAGAAEEVARTIIEAIYPIKVLSQSGNQLVLNQGGKNLAEGYIYDVYGLGKKLVDPYTKESLGREEIHLGQVVIERVATKLSYARVLSGDIGSMAKDTVLRKARQNDRLLQMNHEPEVHSSVTPAAAGGILLPQPKEPTLPVSPVGGVVLPDIPSSN